MIEYREQHYLGWAHYIPADDPQPHTISESCWCACCPDIILDVGTIIHIPMAVRTRA